MRDAMYHASTKQIKIFIPKPFQTAAMPFFLYLPKSAKKNTHPSSAIYPKGGMDARINAFYFWYTGNWCFFRTEGGLIVNEPGHKNTNCFSLPNFPDMKKV